jgi:hypothetical protein
MYYIETLHFDLHSYFVFHDSRNKQIISLNSMNWLVIVMVTQINFRLQRLML